MPAVNSEVHVIERLSYGHSVVGAQELTSGDPQQNRDIDVSEQLPVGVHVSTRGNKPCLRHVKPMTWSDTATWSR